MPIGAGVIVSANPIIYNTSCEIDSITPNPAYCNDALTFNITVTNVDSGPDATGDFNIINTETGVVVATGTLGIRGSGSATSGSLSGSNNFIAQYVGEVNQFLASTSEDVNVALGLLPSSINIIDPVDGYYYCNSESLSVSVEVTDGSSNPATDGYVSLNLYTSATAYINIGFSLVNGSGIANFIIPGLSTTASRTNYLQARFYGGGCLAAGQTAKGTAGLKIYPVEDDNTTLVLSVDGGTTFTATDPVTFIGTVTATDLDDPSDGYVNFYAIDITGPTTIQLGNATPTNGVASLVVPGNTFDTRGTWDLYGKYFSSTDCYDDSSLQSLRINPV